MSAEQELKALHLALAEATEALAEGGDRGSLATVNESLQPLVDAAMKRIKGLERDYINAQTWTVWARSMTGAWAAGDSTVHDTELRQMIADLIREPVRPWRERVAKLGNIYTPEGLDDESLWRYALGNVATKERTAIICALLAERLGVDQRGKSLAELLEMVGRVK